MLLKIDGGHYRSADITLTLGPGVVRYLDPLTLVADAGYSVINEIASFGVAPSIKFPSWDFRPYDIGIETDDFSSAYFKFNEFPSLFESRPYAEIICEVAPIFKSYVEAPFPTEAYRAFYQYTESSRLVLSEFLESWVRETFRNRDLARSYANSNDHILLEVGYNWTYVFRKTDYLLERRKEIEAASDT